MVDEVLSIYPYGLPSWAWLSSAPLGLDDDMTRRNDCDHCAERDGCSGTCPLPSEMTKDEVRRDG